MSPKVKIGAGHGGSHSTGHRVELCDLGLPAILGRSARRWPGLCVTYCEALHTVRRKSVPKLALPDRDSSSQCAIAAARNTIMKRLFAIVSTAGCVIGGAAASAQVPPRVPDVEVRIPAPQPLPVRPIINGPATQGPPPTPATPPALNTFSDRMTQCLHQGSSGGLRGSDLEAYAEACANEN
jgi:hypothetical protein